MSELFYGPGSPSYKVLLLRRCYAIFGGWIDKDKKIFFKQKNKDGVRDRRGNRQEKRKDFANEGKTYHLRVFETPNI